MLRELAARALKNYREEKLAREYSALSQNVLEMCDSKMWLNSERSSNDRDRGQQAQREMIEESGGAAQVLKSAFERLPEGSRRRFLGSQLTVFASPAAYDGKKRSYPVIHNSEGSNVGPLLPDSYLASAAMLAAFAGQADLLRYWAGQAQSEHVTVPARRALGGWAAQRLSGEYSAPMPSRLGPVFCAALSGDRETMMAALDCCRAAPGEAEFCAYFLEGEMRKLLFVAKEQSALALASEPGVKKISRQGGAL